LKRFYSAATAALILHGLLFCIKGDWLKTGSIDIVNTPVSVTLTYQHKEKIMPQPPAAEPPAKRPPLQTKKKVPLKTISPEKVVKPSTSNPAHKPLQDNILITEVIPETVPEIFEPIQAQQVLEPGKTLPEIATLDTAGPFENKTTLDEDSTPYVIDNKTPESQKKAIRDIAVNPDLIDSSYEKATVIKEAIPAYKLNPAPDYPRRAQLRGYEGTVLVDTLVDTKGQAKDFRLLESSGYSLLDKAALASVKKWIFEPGMKGDKTIEMWIKVPVQFNLE